MFLDVKEFAFLLKLIIVLVQSKFMFSQDSSYNQNQTNQLSAVQWLLVLNLVCFVVQNILVEIVKDTRLLDLLMLSWPSLQKGALWSLFTYSLLHDGLFHLLLNALALYFIGRPLEQAVGTHRFLMIYWMAVVIGGLAWMGVHYGTSHHLMGASAAVLGILIYFCCLYPDQPMTLLLFFVIPVTVKPRWLAWSLLAIELFGLVFNEIVGHGIMANSAHLGGMLAGLICFLCFEDRHEIAFNIVKSPLKMFKKQAKHAFTINITQREALKIELDRILDKINIQGFGALTQEEKATLDQAKDMLKH